LRYLRQNNSRKLLKYADKTSNECARLWKRQLNLLVSLTDRDKSYLEAELHNKVKHRRDARANKSKKNEISPDKTMMEQNCYSDKAESKHDVIGEAKGLEELRPVDEDSDGRARKGAGNEHNKRNTANNLVDSIWADFVAK
jgi:hypothetical protein